MNNLTPKTDPSLPSVHPTPSATSNIMSSASVPPGGGLPFSGGIPSIFQPGLSVAGGHGSGITHPGVLFSPSQAAAAYGCRMLLSSAFGGQTPGTVVVDHNTGQPVGIVTPCPPVHAHPALPGAANLSTPGGLASPPHTNIFGHGVGLSLPNLVPRPSTPQQQLAAALHQNAGTSSPLGKNFLPQQQQKKYQPLLPSTTVISATTRAPVTSSVISKPAVVGLPIVSSESAPASSTCNSNPSVSSIISSVNAFSHSVAANTPSGLFPQPPGVAPYPGASPACVLANGVPTVLMRASTGAIVAVPMQTACPGLATAPTNVTTYPPILPHPAPAPMSDSNGGTDSAAPSLPLSEATPTEGVKESGDEGNGVAPPVIQSLPATSATTNAAASAEVAPPVGKTSGKKRRKKSPEKPILQSPGLDTSDMPKLIPGDLFAPTDRDIRSIFMQEVAKNAAYRPGILTHVIDGFLIQESTEPFPVNTYPYEDFIPQEAFDWTTQQIEEVHNPPQLKPEIAEESVCCSYCGKEASEENSVSFEKDGKRFCSKHCYRRYKKRDRKDKERLGSLASPSGLEEEEEETPVIQKQPRKRRRNQGPPEEETGEPSRTPPTSPTPREGGSSMNGEEISPRLPSPDKHPRDWTVEEVYGWVLSLGPGVSTSSEVFKREEIDGAALMLLEEDHLVKALGIKLGPAVKIAAALKTLKGSTR